MGNNSAIKNLTDTFQKVMQECPELVFIGEKILREKTKSVELSEGLEIGESLKGVLAKYRAITGFGRGLAAPQIGIGKSVFVTFVAGTFKVYLNPEIADSSVKKNLYRETCLSCGTLSVDVKRSESVTISYLNDSGEAVTEILDGLMARLIQHEYDHVQGIVNIDRAEPSSIEFMVNDPLKEQIRDN